MSLTTTAPTYHPAFAFARASALIGIGAWYVFLAGLRYPFIREGTT